MSRRIRLTSQRELRRGCPEVLTFDLPDRLDDHGQISAQLADWCPMTCCMNSSSPRHRPLRCDVGRGEVTCWYVCRLSGFNYSGVWKYEIYEKDNDNDT